MPAPEAQARETIDRLLQESGWLVQDVTELKLHAGRGVAARESQLAPGHGFADYLLYVDGRALGVVEAKPAGATLTGVEVQTDRYAEGRRWLGAVEEISALNHELLRRRWVEPPSGERGRRR